MWQAATVVAIKNETRNAKTFRFALAEPSRHLAGQHYVVRLTALGRTVATYALEHDAEERE